MDAREGEGEGLPSREETARSALGASQGAEEDADLRLLADSALDFAMIFTDLRRNVLRWSKGAEAVLGWTEAEMLGQSADIAFTPEDRAVGVPQWEQDQALRTGRGDDNRWMLKKDGTRFFASGVMVPLHDPATGALRGLGKILRDQTDRKRAEDALRASEEGLRASEARLSAIFARAAVGLSEIDLDGRFLRVNDEMCRIVEHTPKELLALSVADVTYPEDIPLTIAAMTRVLEGEETEAGAGTVDKRCLRPDGTWVWTNSSVTLLRDREGRPRSYLVVTVDLTERRRLEEELRAQAKALRQALETVAQANEELEARVAARTEELTRALSELESSLSERRNLLAQVVSAQEEERRRISRELHDEMGQLLTGFSLGLKALETAVTNHCPADSGAIETLERLRTLAGTMGQEVHRLAVELRPTSLDDLGLAPALSAYVEEWSQHTGVPAALAVIGLSAERLPPLVETVIYRVVQEALNNAAKYAVSRGANQVSVTLQRREGDVLAVVEDNGPGFLVPAAIRSGRLGLVGMRERTEMVRGTLEIESTPGEGTTVFLRVPIVAEAENEERS